ncbi:translation initiation factor eIF-2B subunit alpha [Aplysia californica]|uniref:Translation initiation factor eIF2B subunit alpha n=1 Tax=Aplysia californica TaxID=6500 RepID=A0ABM0JNG4_APLCA|nr:translation initiation factor eIF-2B subunit alpha [Aplysia californica]
MDNDGVLSHFKEQLREDPEMSAAVAAIKTLVKLIETSRAGTLSELRDNIKNATEVMLTGEYSYASVSSGCEQFLRNVSLANLDRNFKTVMLERANIFLKEILKARSKTVQMATRFIDDGATILTHCRSRVVMQVLKAAAKENKRFTVYVTESNPDQSGYGAQEELTKHGIPTTVILDAAVGYIMERVQLVMLGAEGVVESGGIINKIGTYPIAITAKSMNKPVYVVAESFKFVRAFPLNQKDVPDHFKYPQSTLRAQKDLSKEHPLVDYTPPEYIDLMFTDQGVLTPSAVSDELIKLYC